MRKLTYSLLLTCIIAILLPTAFADNLKDSFQYLHPVPGSELVSKQTTIIMRTGDYIGSADFNNFSQIQITGSHSGNHGYDMLLAENDKTVILKPYSEFEPGETVKPLSVLKTAFARDAS